MPKYYPPTGYHFRVTFLGFNGTAIDTGFQEVSGISASVGQGDTWKEGGENRFTHRFPTGLSYSNLTLKRGLLNNSDLINWFRNIQEDFAFSTHDITVELLNENHEVIIGWDFIQAYPVKWSFNSLDSSQTSVFAETLEFSYQYYQRTTQRSTATHVVQE